MRVFIFYRSFHLYQFTLTITNPDYCKISFQLLPPTTKIMKWKAVKKYTYKNRGHSWETLWVRTNRRETLDLYFEPSYISIHLPNAAGSWLCLPNEVWETPAGKGEREREGRGPATLEALWHWRIVVSSIYISTYIAGFAICCLGLELRG